MSKCEFPRRMEDIQKRTVVGASSATPTRLDQLTALDWEVDTFALVAWQKMTRTTFWTCVFHSLFFAPVYHVRRVSSIDHGIGQKNIIFPHVFIIIFIYERCLLTSLWRALQEIEGAVTWGQLIVFRLKSRRVMVASLIGPRMNGLNIWTRGNNEHKFQHCWLCDKHSTQSRCSKSFCKTFFVHPTLQDQLWIPCECVGHTHSRSFYFWI